MPTPYNITVNNTEPLAILTDVNTASSGMLGIGFVIVIFFVLLGILSSRYNIRVSFGVSSVITMILSIFIFVIGLINEYIFSICIFVGILGIIALYTK